MNIGNKRKGTMEGDNQPKRVKKECDYGEQCYRRNPAHFREFKHKHLESILDAYSGNGDYPIPEKYVLERLTIMEQLDVIVEKEFYTPWKDKTSKMQASSMNTPSITPKVELTTNTVKDAGGAANISEINNKNFKAPTNQSNTRNSSESSDKRKNSGSSSKNDDTRNKIEGSSSKYDGSRSKVDGSSSKYGSCSKNDDTRNKIEGSSSKYDGSRSKVDGSSSKYGSCSKNDDTRNKIEGSSSKYDGSRSKVDGSSSKYGSSSKNDDTRNKIEGSSSKYDGSRSKVDGSSSSDVNMNRNIQENASYPKAVVIDYRKAPDYRPIVPPTRRVQDYLNVVRPQNKMAAKHAASAPYYIFYTTITAARETHSQPNSITFLEILDPSLGELKCSLQINFMVELGWLLAQYYFAGYSEKRMTILYGEDSNDLRTISQKKPHIDAHKISMPTPFGSHHTKVMILCYEDGSIRVVISTANLYLDDWENRTQGLWFSPACRPLPPGSPPQAGESPTGFKRSLLQYLHHYRLPALAFYVDRVKCCDFSNINVFLCASVPGSHQDREWGLARVGGLLRQHCAGTRWPLIAQASSIGSYGAQPQLWLTGDFLHNLTKVKEQPQTLTAPPELKLIYPSLENVRQSHDGLLGGGCLPYGAAAHSKQPWLNDFLYQWKATSSQRNRAMPHIKSYTRVSADNKMASYYLLTSANCSKAAWGSFNKGNGALRIMSYEAGVLLLPQFVINQEYFPLEGENRLILAYDVPPTKYTSDMSPWVMDYLS